MNEKLKAVLWVVVGIVATVVVFSLIVAIGCAINGFTFGEQICAWFGNNAENIEQVAEAAAKIAIS